MSEKFLERKTVLGCGKQVLIATEELGDNHHSCLYLPQRSRDSNSELRVIPSTSSHSFEESDGGNQVTVYRSTICLSTVLQLSRPQGQRRFLSESTVRSFNHCSTGLLNQWYVSYKELVGSRLVGFR